jgi:hypothetical protein
MDGHWWTEGVEWMEWAGWMESVGRTLTDVGQNGRQLCRQQLYKVIHICKLYDDGMQKKFLKKILFHFVSFFSFLLLPELLQRLFIT